MYRTLKTVLKANCGVVSRSHNIRRGRQWWSLSGKATGCTVASSTEKEIKKKILECTRAQEGKEGTCAATSGFHDFLSWPTPSGATR